MPFLPLLKCSAILYSLMIYNVKGVKTKSIHKEVTEFDRNYVIH